MLGSISLPWWWSNTGASFLERLSKPQAYQSLRGIWTMPLTTCFNFWLALNCSGSWTRWSLQVPSNWESLLYSILVCSVLFLFCSNSIQINVHMGGLFIIFLLQVLVIFLSVLESKYLFTETWMWITLRKIPYSWQNQSLHSPSSIYPLSIWESVWNSLLAYYRNFKGKWWEI